MSISFFLKKSGEIQGHPFLNAMHSELILVIGNKVHVGCSFEFQHFFHLCNILLHPCLDNFSILGSPTLQPAFKHGPAGRHNTENLTINFFLNFNHSININV